MTIFEKITSRIVEDLGAGVIPWKRPYVDGSHSPLNYVSRSPYHGVNLFLLSRPGEYLTENQIASLGGHVRPGARAEFAVFQKRVSRNDDGTIDEDPDNMDGYWLTRWYTLYHVSDVEGVTPTPGVNEMPPDVARSLQAVDDILSSFCVSNGITVSSLAHGDAGYDAAADTVKMPLRERFVSTEEYYCCFIRQLIRATGAPARLDRGGERFHPGSVKHIREELVVEMASSMVANALGVDNMSTHINSVAYLQRWSQTLSDNPRMFIWAARRAESAAMYFLRDVGMAAAA